MKWKNDSLRFEDGDTLRIEDDGISEVFGARHERDCTACEFGSICDRRNKDNILARFCTETHFERKQDEERKHMTKSKKD